MYRTLSKLRRSVMHKRAQDRQPALPLRMLDRILHHDVIDSQSRRRGPLQICQSLAVIGLSLKFVCASGRQLGLSLQQQESG